MVRDTVHSMNLLKTHHQEEVRRPSVYRGDSRSKKSVRLRVWELVRKTVGAAAFRSGPHLFLASREGGDASTLRGLGVPDRAMVAVDADERALQEFIKHYPEIPCRHQDVARVLSEYNQEFASVWLDFSSQVTESTMKKVKSALQAIRPGGVLACTFTIGREKWWNGSNEYDTQGTSEDRLRVVHEFLTDKLLYKPRVLARLEYISESVRGPGALMGVIVVQMQTGRDAKHSRLQTIGFHDMHRDAFRYVDDPNLCWLLNITEDKADELRARVREYPPPP
jgi:hypothetical protein